MPGASTRAFATASAWQRSARFPPSVRSETATTPHAGERERLLQSGARLRPGTGGRKGRLSPRGCDHVVVHVVERDPDSRLSRRPEPTTSSGPTLHKTTPLAHQESKVRSLQGSQGESFRLAKGRATRSTETSERTWSWCRCPMTAASWRSSTKVGESSKSSSRRMRMFLKKLPSPERQNDK